MENNKQKFQTTPKGAEIANRLAANSNCGYNSDRVIKN